MSEMGRVNFILLLAGMVCAGMAFGACIGIPHGYEEGFAAGHAVGVVECRAQELKSSAMELESTVNDLVDRLSRINAERNVETALIPIDPGSPYFLPVEPILDDSGQPAKGP